MPTEANPEQEYRQLKQKIDGIINDDKESRRLINLKKRLQFIVNNNKTPIITNTATGTGTGKDSNNSQEIIMLAGVKKKLLERYIEEELSAEKIKATKQNNNEDSKRERSNSLPNIGAKTEGTAGKTDAPGDEKKA